MDVSTSYKADVISVVVQDWKELSCVVIQPKLLELILEVILPRENMHREHNFLFVWSQLTILFKHLSNPHQLLISFLSLAQVVCVEVHRIQCNQTNINFLKIILIISSAKERLSWFIIVESSWQVILGEPNIEKFLIVDWSYFIIARYLVVLNHIVVADRRKYWNVWISFSSWIHNLV